MHEKFRKKFFEIDQIVTDFPKFSFPFSNRSIIILFDRRLADFFAVNPEHISRSGIFLFINISMNFN